MMRGFPLLAVSAALACAACTDDTKIQSRCSADSDCAPPLYSSGTICREGACVCGSDAACKPDERCNDYGQCQKRVGCETTLDCPPGEYCDLTDHECRGREHCTQDVQCPLGRICDNLRFTCVDGCRDAGDCLLGAVCECPGGASSCTIGACRTGPCADDSYCRYGEKCVEPTDGGPKRCFRDPAKPYCDACTIGPGQPLCPGDTANFCLIDTSKDFGYFYCGVECIDQADCPWGFSCSDVQILTEDPCGGSQHMACPFRGPASCATDEDCDGGYCDTTAGRCRALCIGGEGDAIGGCTCLEDRDCPLDTCDDFSGRCRISLQPCTPSDASSCGRIYCKKASDPRIGRREGYCFVGRNCGPSEGVTCDVVRQQRR